jgi:hypothetical protein
MIGGIMSGQEKRTETGHCEAVLAGRGYREIQRLPAGMPMDVWAVAPDGCESVWAAAIKLENLGPWLQAFLNSANAAGDQADFRFIIHQGFAVLITDAMDCEERFRLR